MKKSVVFISCGQSNSSEKEIGIKIADYFRSKDFEPYFAEEVHTPEGLTSNIFNKLKESEYFICVLTPRNNSLVGSLFVQQELAIACFLEIPTLLFHYGEIKREGISQYLILNPIRINNLEELLQEIKQKTTKWDNKSKNQLFLSFGNPHLNIAILNEQNAPLSDWYHVTVSNLSNRFHVKNCLSYIKSIINLESNQSIVLENDYKTELVWASTGDVSLNIPTGGKRDFDAFYTRHGANEIFFQQRTTSTVYGYKNLPHGHFKIVYVVISENFPVASFEIELKFDQNGVEILSSRQID